MLMNPPLDSVPHLMRPVPPAPALRFHVPSMTLPSSQQPET